MKTRKHLSDVCSYWQTFFIESVISYFLLPTRKHYHDKLFWFTIIYVTGTDVTLCYNQLLCVILQQENVLKTVQGPVVQSVVSLTTSLRVISLTVLADPIHNILIFFAEKMWVAFALQKLLTIFQQKILEYLRITQCKF